MEIEKPSKTLQTMARLSKSWVFNVEIKRHLNTFTYDNANIIKMKANEDIQVSFKSITTTGIKIKNGEIWATLEMTKDQYYRITISQIFWPTLNQYVRELRIDGVLQQPRYIVKNAVEYTAVKVYANHLDASLDIKGATIRNFYLLDVEEMAFLDENPI